MIWSSESGFKRICHLDGHFNWTINFWKDSSRYLDESVFLSYPKLKLSPLHTPLTTSSYTLFPPITAWDFFSQVHHTLPLWLNKRDRWGLVKIIVESEQCCGTNLPTISFLSPLCGHTAFTWHIHTSLSDTGSFYSSFSFKEFFLIHFDGLWFRPVQLCTHSQSKQYSNYDLYNSNLL